MTVPTQNEHMPADRHNRSALQRFSRREALAALGASALASCDHRAGPTPVSTVSIVRAKDYGGDLFGLIRRILTEHKVDVRGQRVVLKPNLVEFDRETTINTHPLVVRAAYEAFRSLGARQVRIAEGPGHRRITLDLAEAAGYFDVFPDFERVFTDLNLDEVSEVKLARPRSKLNSLYLPNTVMSCGLLVSMPKMKTHHWVGATLSMKNLFGVVPGAVYGWPKNILHWAGINECIVDLHNTVPRHFAIVDGIIGMEGNGPIQGTPKDAGIVVAGSNLAAVDATCCRAMMIDPRRVRYLEMAGDRRQTQASSIRQIGEPLQAVETPFEMIPELKSLKLG